MHCVRRTCNRVEFFAQGNDVADDNQARRLEALRGRHGRDGCQGTDQHPLPRGGAVFDERRRHGWRLPMGNQLAANFRQCPQSHIDHQRLVRFHQILPVEMQAAILQMPRDEKAGLRIVAMGKWYPRIARGAARSGDAGDDLSHASANKIKINQVTRI